MNKMIFVLDRICVAVLVGAALKLGYKTGCLVTTAKYAAENMKKEETTEEEGQEVNNEKTEDQ